MLIDSQWPTKTGTRTQVAVTLILGSTIFFVSTIIFHSSLVITGIHEDIDLRDHVERDLLLELVWRHIVTGL